MEPVTHFLTGACIGRAGLNRHTAYATLMVTLTAEFPDIDVLWSFRGPVAGFAHHRGFTHSLVGAPFDALVVLGIVYAFHRWRLSRGKSPPLTPRWGLLFLFGIVAVLSHILLDFTNNYGVRPFLPFNWKWYSWDIVWIVEPAMLAALFLGLILPGIFALVGSEIGAHEERFRGRWSAIAALLIICGMWWVRDYQHRKAVTLLKSTDFRGEVLIRAAAMPYPLIPFTWAGIVETPSSYSKIPLDSRQADVDLDRAQTLYKPAETAITVAAKRSPLGRVYLDWARFSIVETENLPPPEKGYIVHFRDLRFDYSAVRSLGTQPSGRSPLSADVVLDRNLQVVTMRIGNREEQPENPR